MCIRDRQCSEYDSFLIYVSTDYVFDGEIGMYDEDHKPNPISIYGKSKYDGEKAVQSFASNWCIARTSTPYGIHFTKKNFPTWIIDTVKHKKEVNIVSDQFTSPTYVPNLSKMLMEISEKKINGIIHTADTTRISRYNMAELIFDKFNLDKTLLKPVTTDEMNWVAKRPRDSSLNVTKVSSILDNKPQSLEESLNQFFDESKSNNPFAYYTAAVTNSFVRIINIEKRNQNIRDDILEMNDMMPSMTRQTQDTKPPAKKPIQKKFAKKKKK